MVVVCHRGVVEEGGHRWLAGVLDEEVLGRAGVILGGACKPISYELEWVAMPRRAAG